MIRMVAYLLYTWIGPLGSNPGGGLLPVPFSILESETFDLPAKRLEIRLIASRNVFPWQLRTDSRGEGGEDPLLRITSAAAPTAR
jgi:hypothetical protein